jgi:hypothetical protein
LGDMSQCSEQGRQLLRPAIAHRALFDIIMAHSLPLSTSFQTDRALISNSAAARDHADTSHDIDPQPPASGVSSSPNDLFSQQNNNRSSIRSVPTMGSSVSKLAKDADEWQNNGRVVHSNPNDGPNMTETTPLISNGCNNHSQDNSDWRTELWLLSKYTLPVFG